MIFETIPVSFITLVSTTLGLPGLIVTFWYIDHKRLDSVINQHREDMHTVLNRYKEDMDAMRQMYRDNVSLVKGYEKLSDDLAGIITLNTQTMTSLVEQIRHLTEDILIRRGR